MGLEDLKHVERKTTNGADIFVLNNGAIINSEGEAMLQALHSRSIGGFKHHLEILKKRGSDKFMSNFYVGYGHKSIGDCGDATIFVEGVSMLVAKAIQDSKLYNGQEASTRYLDFSSQPFVNPIGTEEGKNILESTRLFYLSVLDPIKQSLVAQNPKKEGEDDNIYDKAINARVFDCARGFLPAGSSTNLAWHSNLRQISDRLLFLRHHPLKEVRDTAETIEDAVLEAYPHSFTKKRYSETESYQEIIADNYFYHNSSSPSLKISSDIDISQIEKFRDLVHQRPKKTELPKFLSHLGNISAEFKLDYGSFRDIQRHRAIDQRMPLLTTELGFNEWYLNNLDARTRIRADEFLLNLEDKINKLNSSKEVKQYYIPMGFDTSNSIKGDLPAMTYLVELRATRFVHPTLRKIAKDIGNYIHENLGVPIHFDSEPDRFDIRRGQQDIVIK